MRSVISKEQYQWAGQVREWMASYAQAEDLINIGAYVRGTNPKIDQAVAVNDKIMLFLRQGIDEKSSFADTMAQLQAIIRSGEAFLQSIQSGTQR